MLKQVDPNNSQFKKEFQEKLSHVRFDNDSQEEEEKEPIKKNNNGINSVQENPPYSNEKFERRNSRPEIKKSDSCSYDLQEYPHLLPNTKYRKLIDRINDRIKSNAFFCSFEYFPPKTVAGTVNLIKICSYLSNANPLFCDITWKTGGDNHSEQPNSSMSIATAMLNYMSLDTMLHMTCVGQSKEDIINVLNKAKQHGIRNILALRGDLPPNITSWVPVNDGFDFAIDLIKFIRQNYQDFFVICVAGYPTGHPEAESYEKDLWNLKKKIDAGADFIITQLFFKASTFLKFVKDCRNIGIKCPILPGILPIQAFSSLQNIARLSKLEIPPEIWERLLPVKDNDEAVRKFGIDYGIETCLELLRSNLVHGLHFYTLNREYASVEILKALGYWPQIPKKLFPWRPSPLSNRCSETVRPIFWSSRPESYIFRTANWEEFPNGRWGNSASASFRDLDDYYLFYVKPKIPKENLLKMWGVKLKKEEDVWKVFSFYLSGEDNDEGVKVTCTPWNDNPLSPETNHLIGHLLQINKNGLLTINSQPEVNGVKSSDSIYGWGNTNGYVYQKAYLEFFMPCRLKEKLLKVLSNFPNVDFHIADSKNLDISNSLSKVPTALTWGVFPNSEIVQPTVYDPQAFKFWKDEAFSLWISQWASLYEEGSQSYKIINDIAQNYLLVNLIDNEFVKPSCLFEITNEILK